ncbi:DUF5325 family protein [Anaerobacillus sp. MEB173]|uniref:DUF5325 family protein n=1 Tax=Anaerobacillus sp. MEB173 TaxID=3383345 RepID=UPI003F9260FE
MGKEKIIFISLATFTALCISLIGVAIAERSILITCIAILGIVAAMGTGFTLKKKIRESTQN